MEDLDFENSFPAIDTQNEVGRMLTQVVSRLISETGCSTRWKDHWLRIHRLYRIHCTNLRRRTRTNPVSCVFSTNPSYSRSNLRSKWREKRNADLARRDAASEKKKAETIAQARRDIDDFYESYNRKTDKQKAETRSQAAEFLKNREDTTAGGTSWERIAKLTDLSGKGQGGGGEGSTKKRMREILLDLKNDKSAPGAGGV